ncbi:MAG: hypothetical protein HKO65_19930 [Gemmatimonadetes bacterium]|nr:hypothetical protein [Gemmatimonadota bacterium]NNM07374.1 hypothetical protein [Gemmatimonadota bacterium]
MFEASLGPPQHHQNLTIFPILVEEERELPYGLMAEALSMGILTIAEKDGGHVPYLLATNTAIHPILILDGEQLIGAKQNRMTNRSIILPPNSITEIPVSCMEEGRWHFVSDDFAPAPQHAPSKVRKKAREIEARSSIDAAIRGQGARTSHRDLAQAQGMVWEEIRNFEDKLGRASDTGALNSVFESRRSELPHWIRAFPLLLGQIGLLAFQGKVPLGMDAVGSPKLYREVHERVLTGYVLDALEGRSRPDPVYSPGPTGGPREDRRPDRDDRRQPAIEPAPSVFAERFIEQMKDADRTPSESVGMGEYRILKGNVVGSELVDQDKLVHLSAFPADDRAGFWNRPGQARPTGPTNPRGGRIARPSQRKGRY